MGPTASGKTDLAIYLREHLPVELISVDSALVYKGMDIGTAKPDAATLAKAPHRLIDFLDPAESYSAMRFREDALREMADIVAAGHRAMMVYLIQREDGDRFALARDKDPRYGEAFDMAIGAGVEAIAIRCKINTSEIVASDIVESYIDFLR